MPAAAASGVVAASVPEAADVFANLPVAALLIDPAGRVAQANAACEQLLNRSERTLRGALLPFMADSDAGNSIARHDATFDLGHGFEFRGDMIASPVTGHPGWRTVVLLPANPRRRVQPGSARAAIGAAAMLAHEIRNPLSGIRGAAQLLAGATPGERPLTGLIVSEVDRIAALIDRMQDFTDTRPLPLTAENVHPLIDHVRQLAQAGFGAGITFDERFDPSLPPALLNRDAFVQILLNLVRNAAEAGAERITLTSAYRTGVSVPAGDGARRPLPIEIGLSDDGPGVPADIAEHLFEPFVSGRAEGRGLGLALVEKLAGQLGGLVQHAREDGRTVFRLLLPRATT